MPSEVEKNNYEKLFINSNIKVDNAIEFFHKTFDAMRLSGIGSAPKLIEMLEQLIEGKACMNVSFEEIIKEREEALNASADTVLHLVLAGAIKSPDAPTISAKTLSELRINDPETKLDSSVSNKIGQMKSFIVYWHNGTTSTVVGTTFAEAFALGDFGCGMQTSINFWEEGETPNPKYEYYGDEWIETSKHT